MKKTLLLLALLLSTLTAFQGESGSGLLKDLLRQVKQERDTTSHAPVDTAKADSLSPRK